MKKPILPSFIIAPVILVAIGLTILAFRSTYSNKMAQVADVLTTSQKEINTKAPLKKYLSEKGKQMLDNELMSPLAKRLKINAKATMMSRCPSGLRHHVEVAPIANSPYFQGIVINYVGCAPHNVCSFRVTEAEDKLDVLDVKQEKYVSAQEWLTSNEESLAAGNF